jgi:hypothetical protein
MIFPVTSSRIAVLFKMMGSAMICYIGSAKMVTVSTVTYAVSLTLIAARVSIMVATGALETLDALIRPIIDS